MGGRAPETGDNAPPALLPVGLPGVDVDAGRAGRGALLGGTVDAAGRIAGWLPMDVLDGAPGRTELAIPNAGLPGILVAGRG